MTLCKLMSNLTSTPIVFAIDDNLSSLKLLKTVLMGSCQLHPVAGITGLDNLRDVEPDLILIDYNLRVGTGVELYEGVIKHHTKWANTPVIFITDNRDPDAEVEMIEAGAVDVIHKPYHIKVLKARVLAHLAARQKTKQLELFARTDGLTGAYNRRAFDDLSAIEWSRALRNQSELSVIMLDIDHFKNVNDMYGHGEGDRALAIVSHLASLEAKRPGDVFARYGGEEFIILLPECGIVSATKIAETIRTNIEFYFSNPATDVPKNITVSLGCATTVPTKTSDLDACIDLADIRLYEAKNAGRNRVEPHIHL